MLQYSERLGSPEYTRCSAPRATPDAGMASLLSRPHTEESTPPPRYANQCPPVLEEFVAPPEMRPATVAATVPVKMFKKQPRGSLTRGSMRTRGSNRGGKPTDLGLLNSVMGMCNAAPDKTMKSIRRMTNDDRRDLQVHHLLKTQSKANVALERVQFEEEGRALERKLGKTSMEKAELLRSNGVLEDRLCQTQHEVKVANAELAMARKRNLKLLSKQEG